MLKKYFLVLVCIIACLGLFLRINQYDSVPPFAETQDEFFYSWAGMTWMLDGNPVAWSWFSAYPNRDIVTYWGATYPLVSPWLEKPPLYTFFAGSWALLGGFRQLSEVRLSWIRLLPIFLGSVTIFLTALLGKKVFRSTQVGLLAGLLYATIPTIVLANRLSLTENLLTPLALVTLILFLNEKDRPSLKTQILVGISAAATVLTKNIGVVAGLAVCYFYAREKNWRAITIVGGFTVIGAILHPLIGYLYDYQLFTTVLSNYQETFTQAGLPELISTLFAYPTVGKKEHLLLDGGMLLGYLLLFASPLWLKSNDQDMQTRNLTLIAFPFFFLTLLALLASGADFSFYGWHVYPLFPFVAIVIAKFLYDLWQQPKVFELLLLGLTLGSSSVRFFYFVQSKEIQHQWQKTLFLVIIFLLAALIPKKSVQKTVLITSFAVFLLIQIFVILNAQAFIPAFPQPPL
ncbi:phospholipid carrier-dependent glycosyltransferase [Candidatus Microgenomates bacterium]|nr:MAG: phospholipid carrier-dependent glycosyltransferase [Candidatus Microgenomates bacterium]